MCSVDKFILTNRFLLSSMLNNFFIFTKRGKRMESSHKREHTKARIISKSLEFVKSRSLEDFSVREVSKELGINIASINYYFSNKENLLGEVVKEVWRSSSDKIENLYLEELEKENWSFVAFFEKLFDHTHEISGLLAFVIKHTLSSNLNVDRNFVSIYKFILNYWSLIIYKIGNIR